jgi:hypothetical protein
MHTLTQLLVGMAAAGIVAGPARPAALIAGAVAGVLPDVVDWWLRQLSPQPDITVTPDPLAPDPAILARGVRLALQRSRDGGRPCVVRLNPLPLLGAGFAAYQLDCDRHHRFRVSLVMCGKSAAVLPSGPDAGASGIITPLHPLPLRVTDAPLDLQFAANGRRIESRELGQASGAGHSLAVAGVAAAAALLSGGRWIGGAAAAALAAHLLLEAGGRREVAPLRPFSSRSWHGRRLWNDRGWRANLIAAALAAATLAACRI